jgi:phage tail-like protein
MGDPTPFGQDFEKLGENRFRLKIVPDLPIGEFRECTGLSMEREILEYTEGGNNDFVYKLPGRMKFPNLVLKRGVTDQKALMKWFWDSRLPDPRKSESYFELATVTVALVDTTGSDARVWAFENAYPVKWAGPNLNAGSDSAATETLEIAHGGFAEQVKV